MDRNGADRSMSAVLEAFRNAGILRDRAPSDLGDDSEAIVHDRLMTNWPQLVTWLHAKKTNSERFFQLSETAQLWSHSDCSPGHLLNSQSAIDGARDVTDDAPEQLKISPEFGLLRNFIAASQASVNTTRRWRTFVFRSISAMVATIAALAVILLYLIWHYHTNEQTFIDAEIRDLLRLQSTGKQDEKLLADQEGNLFRRVSFYETFGNGKIDLSDLHFKNLDLRGYSFYNLRFIRSDITNLNLARKDIKYISPFVFNDSTIVDSHFDNQDLSFSQFRDSIIRNTHFTGANLYRASFDGAKLCQVDFTGASLYLASVWDSRIDDGTLASLRNAAWWLAKGWTRDQINKLAGDGDADLAQANEKFEAYENKQEKDLTEFLKVADQSKVQGIPADIVAAYAKLLRVNEFYATSSGDDLAHAKFNLVQALNQWAWELTINGLLLVPDPKNWRYTKVDEQCSGAQTAVPVPRTALDAATRARCELMGIDDGKGTYDSLRASVEDNIGYILLQKGAVEGALEHLRIGAGAKTRETRDALFRLAVAEYASPDHADRRDWQEDLQASIDLGYVPTHERKLLAPYIDRKYDNKDGQVDPNNFRDHLDFGMQITN